MHLTRCIYLIAIVIFFLSLDGISDNSTQITNISYHIILNDPENISVDSRFNQSLLAIDHIILDIPQNVLIGNISYSLSKEFEGLKIGSLFFEVNKKMKLGETEYATLNITRENLSSGRKILTNHFMAATLSGEAFHIEPLSHEQQLILEDGNTSWTWRVTPLESGIKVLELVVSIRTQIGENNWEILDLPVYKEQILVESSAAYSAWTFLSDNWKYFLSGIGAFIAGVIIALVPSRFKRKSEEK